MAHGPYRGGPSSERGVAAPEGGLVEELIAQFADPLAFYRELVQNGIDAGASAMRVTIAWEQDEGGVARVAVHDDGCGMGRRVLEEQLTVLFRSGKEGQKRKIGKFGVGFVSVLAIAPSLVVVRTCEGGAETWTLHLTPDQRYELFRSEGSASSGTTVTLHVPMARDAFDAFVEGSARALVTWCRHVEVPLSIVARVAGAKEPLRSGRIDRPFGLDALVSVDVTSDDGGTRVVAGILREPRPYLAFFNRGLLLYETAEEVFRGVAVKVLDDRLEHTLSRDDVRRDARYHDAMRVARHAVHERLSTRVRELLEALAERRALEPRIDVLVAALEHSPLELDDADVRFPLLEPPGSIPASRLDRCCAARAPSVLTRAIAAAGASVLDLSVAEDQDAYLALLSRLAGGPIALAEERFVLAEPDAHDGSDDALLEVLARVLSDALRAPASPRFVRLSRSNGIYVSGASELPAALTREDASRDPFRRMRRPALWLDADAPVVRAARHRAKEDPILAGALLARAVLVQHGSLDDERDDAWLASALERVSDR